MESKLNTEHIFLTFIFVFIVKIKAKHAVCFLEFHLLTLSFLSLTFSTLVTSSTVIFKAFQKILCFEIFNGSCRECY